MLKEYTCIICPNGCELTAEITDGRIVAVRGATCRRGRDYVEQELTNPQRNIASSILLEGGELPLVSVRLSKPIPKEKILAVMAVIKKTHLRAPVRAGQVVIPNVLGLGSDVIVTKHVAAK
jgi:CxxC motif-containing protein